MSPTACHCPHEKTPLIEVLPVPVIATRQKKRPSCCHRLFKVVIALFGALFVLDLLSHGPVYRRLRNNYHGFVDSLPDSFADLYVDALVSGGGEGGQPKHPVPPMDDWTPFEGTTHFEIEPRAASGLAVHGDKAFGKVVFETSKLSDKVVIDLDIKTNKLDKHGDVIVEEKNGHLTIRTPDAGKLETYASAKIQIPSNILGTFGMRHFDIDVPAHMVDYSALPKSLEIGDFAIRVAKGFVKPGPVHTNRTAISIADGAVRGSLTHGRQHTEIDVAKGNATVDIPRISAGNEGSTHIHIGNGHLNGTLAVYNSTSVDVGFGSIWIDVDFKDTEHRAHLSTKIVSGPSRVFVDSLPPDRLFRSEHLTVAGDQLITYPSSFEGTIDARGFAGDIKLTGDDLDVEEVVGGAVGRKGDWDRNYMSVKAVKGALDILVGDDDES
ncbi:hypothetical protein PV08_01423 [Exophiala spinifera]|uniref:Adhesin domain-containing protein n=1 Tax=Exophiala spinifera TaxID=91928 RepID=A0A0D2BQU6_9EURO|nr:uncharacterized protein PV08_01423 [Exophiala spinifera]KIW20845.1 hypothetical protein PV08_01423 [Exophiala spinifera]